MSYTKEQRAINSVNGYTKQQANSKIETGAISNNFTLPNKSGEHVRSIKREVPVHDEDLVNKKYVDDNAGLWEVDGTETQLKTADEIDMQSKKIINVTDPAANQDAATKKYVDDNSFSLPALTSGSVMFSDGTTIAQDNSNFFWDDTNDRLGIGTNSPTKELHVAGKGYVISPTFPVLATERTTSSNSRLSAQDLKLTSSGFTSTGFGPAYSFSINDAGTSGLNIIARISGVRDGTINSGKFIISTNNSGTEGDNFTVDRYGYITIGAGVAGRDYKITFNGQSNDGVLTWKEDEDYFEFSDDINMQTGETIKNNGTTIIDGSGFSTPVSSADAAAPNNSIYYSTDASKLVYKDSGGSVNNLY